MSAFLSALAVLSATSMVANTCRVHGIECGIPCLLICGNPVNRILPTFLTLRDISTFPQFPQFPHLDSPPPSPLINTPLFFFPPPQKKTPPSIFYQHKSTFF